MRFIILNSLKVTTEAENVNGLITPGSDFAFKFCPVPV